MEVSCKIHLVRSNNCIMKYSDHYRKLMMVSLLHSPCSAISDVVNDWLSIKSRMRESFAGDSLGAISPSSRSREGL